MPTWARQFRDPPQSVAVPDGLLVTGAVLAVEIHVPTAVAALLTQQGHPVPTGVPGWALIDTGATFSCVHEQAFLDLGLAPVGVASMLTANGPADRPTYPGRLVFPEIGWDFDLPLPLACVDLTGQVISFGPNNPSQPILMLLGRDLLSGCVLIWNGPAAIWSLSY